MSVNYNHLVMRLNTAAEIKTARDNYRCSKFLLEKHVPCRSRLVKEILMYSWSIPFDDFQGDFHYGNPVWHGVHSRCRTACPTPAVDMKPKLPPKRCKRQILIFLQFDSQRGFREVISLHRWCESICLWNCGRSSIAVLEKQSYSLLKLIR